MPQVQVIQPIQQQPKRLRVAAYARVSSDSAEYDLRRGSGRITVHIAEYEVGHPQTDASRNVRECHAAIWV